MYKKLTHISIKIGFKQGNNMEEDLKYKYRVTYIYYSLYWQQFSVLSATNSPNYNFSSLPRSCSHWTLWLRLNHCVRLQSAGSVSVASGDFCNPLLTASASLPPPALLVCAKWGLPLYSIPWGPVNSEERQAPSRPIQSVSRTWP